jgi:DNA-binding response OmpR family regulator
MRTILLVDGTEIMRHALAKSLAGAGFEVLQAGSGQEARALLDSYPRTVDLLITEEQLAETTGESLFSEVKPYRPGMRVLYLSGRGVGSSDTFLVRPFALDEFMHRVGTLVNRRALERRSGAAPGREEEDRRRSERRRGLGGSPSALNPALEREAAQRGLVTERSLHTRSK